MAWIKKRDHLITIAVLALLVVGFAVFVYGPYQRAAATIPQETAAAGNEIKQVLVRLAELRMLRDRIAEREQFLRDRAKRIPARVDLPGVLKRVSALAERWGLHVSRLEPAPAEELASYRRIPIRVSVQGGYAGLARFLAGLESQERLFHVEQIAIKAEKLIGVTIRRADVAFSVYVIREGITDFAENDDRFGRPATDIRTR